MAIETLKEPDWYLRHLEKKDLEQFFCWHRDPEIFHSLVGRHRFVSRERLSEWLLQAGQCLEPEMRLAICSSDDKPIGAVYFLDYCPVNRAGEMHIFLGAAGLRGHGLGYAVTNRFVGYLFDAMNVRRISLQVLADNAQAIAMYEKCGFQTEGLLRDAVYKDGQYKDVRMMALLKGERMK